MAKLTLTDITSGYASTTTINANNALVEAALENTLSLDGTAPNAMQVDLDMNSNKLTNVANGSNSQDAVTLAQVESLTGQAVVGFLTEIVQDTSPQLGGNLLTGGYNVTMSSTDQIVFNTATSAGSMYHDGSDLRVQSGVGDINLVSAADMNITADNVYTTGELYLTDGASLWFGAGDGTDGDVEMRYNGTSNALLFVSSSAADRPILFDESIEYVSIDTGLRMNGEEVQYPRLTGYRLTSSTPTSSSGAITFNLATSNAFQVTLTENITGITIIGAPSSGTFGECIIKFVQDGTGSRTVAGWPASVQWATGSAPTITTTATTGTDIITLKTWNAGTTWYGDYSQDYS